MKYTKKFRKRLTDDNLKEVLVSIIFAGVIEL